MKDLLGILGSSLCVVHCLVVPTAIAVGVPLAGMTDASGEKTHLVLSLLVLLLAVWAFPSGWFRHRQVLPGLLALVGVSFLVMTVFTVEAFEAYWATLAAFCLIAAHLMNRYLLGRNLSIHKAVNSK